MDSLKDLTWSLLDMKNEKAMEKLDKKAQILNLPSNSASNRNSLKRLSLKLFTTSKKDLISNNNRKSMNSSEKPLDIFPPSPKKLENQMLEDLEPKIENDKLQVSLQDTQNSDHEITSNERYSTDLDPEDLKMLNSIIFKMKIAKFFSSNIVKILLVCFLYGFATLAQATLHGVFEGVTAPNACQYSNLRLANGFSSLISALIIPVCALILHIILFTDLFLFIKEYGFRWKVYLFVDDPFGFRIEMILGCLYTGFGVALSFTTFILALVTNVIASAPVNSLRGELFGIGLSIFLVFAEWIIAFWMVILPLIFSIISYVKRMLEPTIYDTEFDAFLGSKEGKAIFKKYAKKEWSLENILFYEDVEKYKKIWTFKYAKKRAEELCTNYIEVGSNLELNIPAHTRKLTKKKVQDFKEYKDVYKTIFDEAIKETKRNMKDTYSRIRRTLEFTIWQQSSKALIESTSS